MARFILIACVIAPLIICCGCAENSISYRDTPLARNWGLAYETQKNHQIVNPEGAKNPALVEGLDGAAGVKSTKSYLDSFEQTVPRPVYNVTIGPIGGM